MRVPNLYVCSLESFWGKSAFCLGLALTIQEKGYKIGYFKPVGWEMGRDRDGRKIDEDAQLMKEILGLKSPLDIICPFVLGSRYLEESAKIDPGTNQEKVLQAYNEASKGMDIMILEGPYSMGVGTSIGVEPIFLTKMLDSKMLLVSKVDNDTFIDRIICNKKCLDATGGNFLGTILNFVHKTSFERVKGFGIPVLQNHGIKVFGIIPDDVSLRAPTVGEICDNITCTVLTCNEKMDLLVEELLVGAMTPESALSYFRRSLRKAVITGGDRSDIQLAALQTDTSVLILTGNIYPDVRVLAKAEELGVPILLVPYDTFTTIKRVATLSGRIKPRDAKKIEIAKQLVEQYVDWPAILERTIKHANRA